MRILSNHDVEQVLSAAECMAALEVAYKEFALGQGANRPRNHTYFPVRDERHPDFQFRFKSQEGGNASSGGWAVRTTSEMMGSETLPNGVKRRRNLPLATGGKYCGLITLYSIRQLEPLAIIHDSYIQKLRCSATSALGIRALSNPDARVAGLFGAGWQAQSHLEYMLLVRPGIEEVRVSAPVKADRENFARHWSDKTGVRVVPVEHAQDAVKGCQIVTCATNTFNPCFDGSWLEPGTHVTCITHPDGEVMRRELDDTTYDRADRIVVLSREQVHHDKQIDILGPVQRGRKKLEELGELGELLLGNIPGRTQRDQITIFANNTGMGLQFAAVGARVLELAEKQGLGREIPTDWFLEETPP
jgi:alanine dehydrogenase